MAIFLNEDAQTLLREKMVVVIGDSVQRAVYKDLVCLLAEENSRYLSNNELKSKGELSFLGDKLLNGGQLAEMTNGKNYRETRRFENGHTVIKFYFVTRCYSEHVQSILDEMKQFQPHLVIMNSCLWDLHRYGLHGLAAFKVNLGKLVFALNSTLHGDSVFIWNATLPLASKCKGGFLLPLFDTIPSLEIVEANFFARNLMNSSKRLFLDLHAIFSQQIHHRAKDGVHWDKIAHRRITNVILTELCRLWNRPLPRRSLLEPNSWSNVFPPCTPPLGILPRPRALLPTPSSLNCNKFESNYTSLLGPGFSPLAPSCPLSASFSGGTGIFDKCVVNSGTLSDGNDYEDVETAREYKQRFRFSSTISTPVENTSKHCSENSHDQDNGKNGDTAVKAENFLSEPGASNSKTCSNEFKQPGDNCKHGWCPTSPVKIEADRTNAEQYKRNVFETDVELNIAHENTEEVKLLPRSISFTCSERKNSSVADPQNISSKNSSDPFIGDSVDTEKKIQVETELHVFDNQQCSFTEESVQRSSTPCLPKQCGTIDTSSETRSDEKLHRISEDTFAKLVKDKAFTTFTELDVSPIVISPLPQQGQIENASYGLRCEPLTISGGSSEAACNEETRVSDVFDSYEDRDCNREPTEEKGSIRSPVPCSVDLELWHSPTHITENTNVLPELSSKVAAVDTTRTLINNEEEMPRNESHCTKSEKKKVAKAVHPTETTQESRTTANEIRNQTSGGRKRKRSASCEKLSHKKQKKENASKCGVGQSQAREGNIIEKGASYVQRKKQAGSHRDTSSSFCKEELLSKSKKGHRSKHRHSHPATKRSSKEQERSFEKHDSSSSGKSVSERKACASTCFAEPIKESSKFRIDQYQEDPQLKQRNSTVVVSVRSLDEQSKNKDVDEKEPTSSSTCTKSECLDSHPVQVVETNRQDFFKQPNNPPPRKAVQSTVTPNYRYSPYQYQYQHLSPSCRQPTGQPFQQQSFYNWTRTPWPFQQQYYRQSQQGLGNVYINASHPAMRQTVAEWQRLMSLYGQNRYY